jgi:hypothetical protein
MGSLDFLVEPSGRISAVVFATVATLISLLHIGYHLQHYAEPMLQVSGPERGRVRRNKTAKRPALAKHSPDGVPRPAPPLASPLPFPSPSISFSLICLHPYHNAPYHAHLHINV